MGQTLEKQILTITNPVILIDKMTMTYTDTEDPTQDKNPINSTEREFKKAGAIHPLLSINTYQFTAGQVLRLRLESTGFLPELSVTVVSTDGMFLSKFFPKDGDPISLFIRSKTDEFKPIRADFEITSVSSSPSEDNEGELTRFNISAHLRIPFMFSDHTKTFGSLTSFKTLLALCNELKIGFASNDTTTDDEMKWICPDDTYHKFMNDVTAASYKNENSFFKSFIDWHYFFNFVNVNNQFSDKAEFDDALDTVQDANDFFTGQTMLKIDTKIMLCNHKSLNGSGNYIQGYTLINNSGQVVVEDGYRRYAKFYDEFLNTSVPSDKYQSHYVEPMDTAGVSDKILLKGRVKEPEIFKNTQKCKWLGSQMSLPNGNTHKNYLYAGILNWQNTQNLEKLILKVSLGKPNFNLYRGQRVPVVILNSGNALRQKMSQDLTASNSNNISHDKFLSGYYMIHSIEYSWTQLGGFHQELLLTKREWPIPPQTMANKAQG